MATPITPTVAAWSAVLDEIELSLRLVDAWLAPDDDTLSGELPAGAWMPPDGLGAIPAELVPRARVVLGALAAAADSVARARDEVQAELAGLTQAARAPGRRSLAAEEPPLPRLVDHSA